MFVVIPRAFWSMGAIGKKEKSEEKWEDVFHF